MAIKKFYLGSMGPFYYDDSEAVDDPDGDFPGVTRKTVLTDGDVNASAVTQTTGLSTAVDLVVDIRDNAGTVEKKTQTLTFTDGLLTNVSTVSGWTAV